MSDENGHRIGAKARAFLAAYEINLNISESCRQVEADRRRVYEWKKNPRFLEEMQIAYDNGVERLEEEARRRAVDGVIRKKFDGKGDPVIDPETGQQYVEREYSDRMLQLLLRRYKPEAYGPAATGEGGTIIHHHGGATPHEVLQQLQQDPEYLEFLRQKATRGVSGPEDVVEA